MELTCYPTYGYKDENGKWKILVRLWLYENCSLESDLARDSGPFVVELAEHFAHHSIDRHLAKTFFEKRIAYFLRHGVSGKMVALRFADPTNRTPSIIHRQTNEKGLLIDILDQDEIPGLVGEGDRWVDYTASVEGVPDEPKGRVRLLDKHGVSLISDIDDTIKITEIPADKEIVAVNTFFREFVLVNQPDNMLSMYLGRILTPGGVTLNSAVSFHYVSGGPWQLYEPLWDFLIQKNKFPEGTFHLRSVDLQHEPTVHWDDLLERVEQAFDFPKAGVGPSPGSTDDAYKQNATYIHKMNEIRQLMTLFPERKFLMFGDSGELDPEVYRDIQTELPHVVVEKPSIRNVNDLVRNHPERWEWMKDQMTVRDAIPIIHGRSQFDPR